MEFDIATGVLLLHVFVGTLFVGLGIQNLLAGRPLGLVLQGALGVLIIVVGVAAARLVSSRPAG